MKRFPRPLNPFGAEWNRETADKLYEFLRSLWWAVGGSQGTPDTPSTVSAGVSADPGIAQAPSPSDHIHPLSTSAPSVKVAYSGTPLEGGSASVLRSDSKNILADGDSAGDILWWNGSSWISLPPHMIPGLPRPIGGDDGEEGPMGPPGIQGPAGAAGSAGASGPAGMAGAQGLDGSDGEDGPMGPPGPAGADGVAGATGPQGPQGIPGIGFDGEDGEDGYPIPGPQGPQGPAGGGGGGSWTEVEIDFGSVPVYEATFVITDALITSSSVKVIIVPCGKAATGRTADDWQWDGGTFAANPGTGSATCYASFFPGPIVGKRKLQYSVA